MEFEVGNPEPATRNIWRSVQNETTLMRSAPLDVTDPVVTIFRLITGVAAQVSVGTLTTLTTSEAGIICSACGTVDTGTQAS